MWWFHLYHTKVASAELQHCVWGYRLTQDEHQRLHHHCSTGNTTTASHPWSGIHHSHITMDPQRTTTFHTDTCYTRPSSMWITITFRRMEFTTISRRPLSQHHHHNDNVRRPKGQFRTNSVSYDTSTITFSTNDDGHEHIAVTRCVGTIGFRWHGNERYRQPPWTFITPKCHQRQPRHWQWSWCRLQSHEETARFVVGV